MANNAIEQLIAEIPGLEANAKAVQAEDDVGNEDAGEDLRDKYEDWYARALAQLTGDQLVRFKREYEGMLYAPRIKEFLARPLLRNEDYGVQNYDGTPAYGADEYFKHPFSTSFKAHLRNQKQILREALHSKAKPSTASQNQEPSKTSPITVIVQASLSQKQVQEISQSIDLSKESTETRKAFEDLLSELQKQKKNKSRIKELVKYLADKSIDVLIAYMVAHTGITK